MSTLCTRTRGLLARIVRGGIPASRVAGTDLGAVIVLDVDATIVIAHSEKDQATPTFKKTFGFHPIGVWCDNTQEFLAATLRPGRAGSNTAADHIQVLGEAIAQIPAGHRAALLIRSDGAGASHKLVAWLHEQDQLRGRRVLAARRGQADDVKRVHHRGRGRELLGGNGRLRPTPWFAKSYKIEQHRWYSSRLSPRAPQTRHDIDTGS